MREWVPEEQVEVEVEGLFVRGVMYRRARTVGVFVVNDSYSDDEVPRERQGVELCLTTTGAKQAGGTVTAG